MDSPFLKVTKYMSWSSLASNFFLSIEMILLPLPFPKIGNSPASMINILPS